MSAGATRFVNDLVVAYAWATPEPVGYVEPGWVTLVSDLLRSVDHVMSTSPGATLDILDVGERDGALEVCCVLDGGDALAAARIREALLAARRASTETCPRCGARRSSPSCRPCVAGHRRGHATTPITAVQAEAGGGVALAPREARAPRRAGDGREPTSGPKQIGGGR